MWKHLGDTDPSLRSELWYLPVYCVCFFCWFMLLILSSLPGLILRWTVLPGQSETTCGPARHPTESWKLCSTESSLQEEMLTDIVTPLTAMVTAQSHRQAEHGTRTTVGVRTRVRFIRWFWGSEVFLWRFSVPCFQQTAQCQIWGQKPDQLNLCSSRQLIRVQDLKQTSLTCRRSTKVFSDCD